MMSMASARERLLTIPALDLWPGPSPVQELTRLRQALGGGPRLLIKRDDAIPFGFGGNKVRKVALEAARAIGAGADTLLSVGGVQSNSARIVAATAARMGLKCVLVANGTRQDRPTANALLDDLLGAEVHYVATREERAPAMAAIADRLRDEGRQPYEIPLGASTSLGALGFARGIGELVSQGIVPDVIVHSTSSGGTQSGMIAGCAIYELPTRVVGISADDSVATIQQTVHAVVTGMGELLGVDGEALANAQPVEVDDTFIGDGYGVPSAASREAASLLARNEAMFLDHTYTAKAMAGLIARLRQGVFSPNQTVLFWHTGGQVGLFA
jgi:1-aminocyclopropane-1-carboxylate deaminase/D-cysteine desulfhydrase-like pyridoxal-dependent ACC family enzyme